MKKIMIINGPNINMLGIREKNIYGEQNYNSLINYIKHQREENVNLQFFQSNSEGAIIDCIQNCYYEKYDGIVINPAAYTHYSYAILDAIKAVQIPTVEVHISDINSREEFRHYSVTKSACIGQIAGHGFKGYVEAIDMILNKIGEQNG